MYKSPFTENDLTMSVGSEDDMRITYDPSFEAVLREGDDDDDSSTVPPPPPPPMLFSGNSIRDSIRGSIFRQKSTSNNKATSRHQREAEEGPPPVEIIASKEEPEEESHIELDASVGWAEAFKPEKDTSRRPQRRLALICAASVLFLCLLLGLAIGLSGNGKDDSNQTSQSSSAALQGEEQEQQQQQQQQSDVAPTEAPVPVDTFVPTPPTDPVVVVTAAPVAAPPTMSPTFPVPVPDTAAPTQVCANTLSSISPCHEPFQEIGINFSNCEPRVDDWIGIWPAGSDPSSLPEPTLWLWTCGTLDCTTAVDQGSVFFFGFENIADGSYAAHLVRLVEEQAPYTSTYAISGAFDITSATCT